MTEAEWLSATRIYEMSYFLREIASDRKCRLFSVSCCREQLDRLPDEQSRHAVDVAERYADGDASDAELAAAETAARALADSLNQWCRAPAAPAEAASHRVHPTEGTGIGGGMSEWYDHSKYWEAVPEFLRSGLSHSESEPMVLRQIELLRDIFGNPFRPVRVDSCWLTSTVLALTRGIYEERAFDRMPILADALQDAGCDSDDVLNHCRGDGPHVRGCWVVDLVLGKS